MRWSPLFLASLVLVVPTVLRAQTPVLEPGVEVRVAHYCAGGSASRPRFSTSGPSTRTLTGELSGVTADTVKLRADATGVLHVLPSACILDLSVRDGTGSQTMLGLGLGLAGGVMLGALVGSASDFCVLGNCSSAAGIGAILGAPVGMLIGAAIGTAFPAPRWRAVPLPRGTPVVSLGRGGVAVSVLLR